MHLFTKNSCTGLVKCSRKVRAKSAQTPQCTVWRTILHSCSAQCHLRNFWAEALPGVKLFSPTHAGNTELKHDQKRRRLSRLKCVRPAKVSELAQLNQHREKKPQTACSELRQQFWRLIGRWAGSVHGREIMRKPPVAGICVPKVGPNLPGLSYELGRLCVHIYCQMRIKCAFYTKLETPLRSPPMGKVFNEIIEQNDWMNQKPQRKMRTNWSYAVWRRVKCWCYCVFVYIHTRKQSNWELFLWCWTSCLAFFFVPQIMQSNKMVCSFTSFTPQRNFRSRLIETAINLGSNAARKPVHSVCEENIQ